MRIRLSLIILFFTALYSVLIFKVYNIQIRHGSYYAARAASQHQLAGFLESLRGNIYFLDRNRNAIPAAIVKSFPVIFAVPIAIEDPELSAEKLAPIVSLSKEKLLKMLNKQDDQYELLVRKATSEQAKQIRDLNLKGIY